MSIIKGILDKLASVLIALLPKSPVAAMIAQWTPPEYLGYLAWFFPVGAILDLLALWLVAVAIYFGLSVLLRWAKIIGG